MAADGELFATHHDIGKRPSRMRKRRGELADKATRRRIRRWRRFPEGAAKARTCRVHAVLARSLL